MAMYIYTIYLLVSCNTLRVRIVTLLKSIVAVVNCMVTIRSSLVSWKQLGTHCAIL